MRSRPTSADSEKAPAIEIKITGFDEIQRRLDRMAKAVSPDENARLWRTLRCPVHGEAPTVVRVVGNEVEAGFCCEQARQAALAATERAVQSATR